jgi:hypothetical protein
MKTKPFFVFGFPRSGTARMANLLTTDRSHCAHEITASLDAITCLPLALDSFQCEFAGSSDSGLTMGAQWIERHMPEVPCILIRRDRNDVFTSVVETVGTCSDQALDRLSMAADWVSSHMNVVEISFDMMDDEPTMRHAWAHVFRDQIPWSHRRWSLLSTLNVQVSRRRIQDLHAIAERKYLCHT